MTAQAKITLAQAFANYMERVESSPHKADTARMMRGAFFAGAHLGLEIIARPTVDAIAQLEAWSAELERES